jgi:ketopantoate reductase
MADNRKKTVLVVGGGSVGAVAALNLEVGGLANVSLACGSNYTSVCSKGFTIESCDHGKLVGWKPNSGTSLIESFAAIG